MPPAADEKPSSRAAYWAGTLALLMLGALALGVAGSCWYRAELFEWSVRHKNALAFRWSIYCDDSMAFFYKNKTDLDYSKKFGNCCLSNEIEAHEFFLKNHHWNDDLLRSHLEISIAVDHAEIAKNIIKHGIKIDEYFAKYFFSNGSFDSLGNRNRRKRPPELFNGEDLVNFLIENSIEIDPGVLKIAALYSKVEIIERLIANGADTRQAIASLQLTPKTTKINQAIALLSPYLPEGQEMPSSNAAP